MQALNTIGIMLLRDPRLPVIMQGAPSGRRAPPSIAHIASFAIAGRVLSLDVFADMLHEAAGGVLAKYGNRCVCLAVGCLTSGV